MSNSFWSCRHYLLLRFEFDMIRYDQNSTPSQNMKLTLLPLSYNSVVNIDTVSKKDACAKSVCLLIQNTLFISNPSCFNHLSRYLQINGDRIRTGRSRVPFTVQPSRKYHAVQNTYRLLFAKPFRFRSDSHIFLFSL